MSIQYVIECRGGGIVYGYVYFFRNGYGPDYDVVDDLYKAHLFREKIVAEYLADRFAHSSSFFYEVVKVKKSGKHIELYQEGEQK